MGRASLLVLLVLLVLAVHLLASAWLIRHIDVVPQAEPVSTPVEVALLKAQPIRRGPLAPARSHAPSQAAHADTGQARALAHDALQAVDTQRAERAARARARAKAAALAAAATATATAASATEAAHAAAPHASAASEAAQAASAASASAAQLDASSSAAARLASVHGASDASAASAPPAATASGASAALASAAAASPASGADAHVAGVAAQGLQFSLPPAADLRYDTFYNGARNMPGTISWLTDGEHYDLVVSVPLPFVGTFSYLSHGHVDAYGLAPERYTEQRGSRGRDETRFARDANQVTFTRTPNPVTLRPGTQDRFSMVFQLASLVRGDPARYTPGVTRVFFVVDNDSGEEWPVETLGMESVNTGNGFVSALHFARLPRHAGDRRKIDVWLAPSFGYFPVRFVQTEPNGTEIELLLHDAPRRLETLQGDAGDNAAPRAAPAIAVPHDDQAAGAADPPPGAHAESSPSPQH